ncbi:thioredoxin domain-containing [Micractinium conductrix]|uniref:Thioredoxin domain-containing n=1 Tax=Micractinium conductrix TaxID=554055 RepID=A0A2P6VPM4_9CHLO|nr:thioredoxin domain-containing [Micractinium conductrix]|eukprot:PSC76005.1 thioredoxin domain-containing [Micractinium conductrix]
MRQANLLALALAACCLAVLPSAAAQRRRSLNDDTFEHVTQAATGQTTGVWFVSFCSPSARACKDLAGSWEELGRELLQRQPAPIFLTTVDPHSAPALARRFAISTLPTLLLFRDRKMYRFPGKLTPDTDAKGVLRRFAEEGYVEVAREEVPPPASPLDWILKAAAAKVEVVKAAIEAQDLHVLAKALLPVLGVCLLAILLLLANVGRKAKRD